ncbi:MAG: ABC transporter permease [Candidatus Kapaibacteriales bacterium]
MLKLSEIYDSFQMAVSSLLSNKMRSTLASLGIVVGISIVVLIGWAIRGLDSSFEKTFEIIGVDILFVDKWDWAGRVDWREARKRKNITYDQYEELKDRLEYGELVLPEVSNWGSEVTFGDITINSVSMVGVLPENVKTPAGNLIKGRYFSQLDQNSKAETVVIGHKIYETLFPNGEAIGKEVKINKRSFTVIGVIEKRGTVIFDGIDNQVFMPQSTFKKVFGTAGKSFRIAVKTGSKDNLEFVKSEVIGIFRGIRGISPGADSDFSINESNAFKSMIDDIKRWVYLIGISMTSLSFLVGIIGIMNIMFVSVTERTKEIGIRKSLGAKRISIIVQFVTESMLLCLAGSIIAIAFCYGLVNLISFAVDYLAQSNETFENVREFVLDTLPVEIMVIAVTVSAIVGILAGIIPARRAADLDPVDALRAD